MSPEVALEKARQLEHEYRQKLRSCKEHKKFMRFLGKEEVRQEHLDAYCKWRESVFLEERKAWEDAYDEWEKLTEETQP